MDNTPPGLAEPQHGDRRATSRRSEARREQLRSELREADEPVHTGDHLDELTARYNAVLVECCANWCGPCKQLEPLVERVAATTDAAVANVDIDTHQRLAQQQQLRGVPTMAAFADGVVATSSSPRCSNSTRNVDRVTT